LPNKGRLPRRASSPHLARVSGQAGSPASQATRGTRALPPRRISKAHHEQSPQLLQERNASASLARWPSGKRFNSRRSAVRRARPRQGLVPRERLTRPWQLEQGHRRLLLLPPPSGQGAQLPLLLLPAQRRTLISPPSAKRTTKKSKFPCRNNNFTAMPFVGA
jgi:hypothetical protein